MQTDMTKLIVAFRKFANAPKCELSMPYYVVQCYAVLCYTVPCPNMGHPVAMNIFDVNVRTVTFSHNYLYMLYCFIATCFGLYIRSIHQAGKIFKKLFRSH
jgi:hypothetical protein